MAVAGTQEEAGQGGQGGPGAWHHGACKWFNPTKGWGFLNMVPGGGAEEAEVEGPPEVKEVEDGKGDKDKQEAVKEEPKADTEAGGEDAPSGDIFVHQSVIQKDGFRCLEPGERVEFQAVR